MFICGIFDTSVCWYFKTKPESGPLTADLTTTVVHSFKLLRKDIKPVHLLNPLIHLFICWLIQSLNIYIYNQNYSTKIWCC